MEKDRLARRTNQDSETEIRKQKSENQNSVFRFPISVFRFPFSVFRFPFSVFRLPTSDFRFPFSIFPFVVVSPPDPGVKHSSHWTPEGAKV